MSIYSLINYLKLYFLFQKIQGYQPKSYTNMLIKGKDNSNSKLVLTDIKKSNFNLT